MLATFNLAHLAAITHGFVGADLEALCREAAMLCLRRLLPAIDFASGQIPYETLRTLEVRMADFEAALCEVEPSAIREVFVELPDVGWDDVGGLDQVKQRLIESVEWPLKYGEVFGRAGVRPPKGILLSGPPGCGKTLLAKAVASQTQVNFISVKGPSLLSKYVGESERGVREVFRKAKQAAPCIVFIDEIDALVPTRGGGDDSHVTERVIGQFLAEIDGVEELNGVLILGATNRPDILDPALHATRPIRPPIGDPAARRRRPTRDLPDRPPEQARIRRRRHRGPGRADRGLQRRRDPGGLHPSGLVRDPRGHRTAGARRRDTRSTRHRRPHRRRAGGVQRCRSTLSRCTIPSTQTGPVQRRESSINMRIAQYLYGFARTGTEVPPELKGIEEAPVYLMGVGRLAALVGDIPAEPFESDAPTDPAWLVPRRCNTSG